MNEIVQAETALESTIKIQLDQNPAAVYLVRLGTENSRYGMRWCLNLAASILSNDEPQVVPRPRSNHGESGVFHTGSHLGMCA